ATSTKDTVAQTAISGIRQVNQTAISGINTVAQKAILKIKTANQTAIAEINIATPTSIAEINTATQAALSEINIANQTAIAEINTATPLAMSAVNPASAAANQTVSNLLPSPTGLTATGISSSKIILNWNAPSDTGKLVTGYKIERSNNGGTSWFTVKSNTGSTVTSYVDTQLIQNTTYTYRVSAIYQVGTSMPSNTASASTSIIAKLTVTSQFTTGQTLTGMYCELHNSNGQLVATGFTPCSFDLQGGSQYTIGMGSFGNDTFNYWLDTGSSVNPRTISLSSNAYLTAVYKNTS
ncbi:MAG: fibronectin type III domain-containing protein, partial [Patescibacteria group bacterium]|nr:fibronectin type III domain-containing protein [Patescibacteria group bacterium]